MSVKVIVRVMPIQLLPEFRLGGDFLEVLFLLIHLLKPASLGAFLLGFWRLGSDLGWTSDFIYMDGILSRWQLWMLLGAVMVSMQSLLTRRLVRV